MSPILTKNGQISVVDGYLATSLECCCCGPCKNTYPPCPSGCCCGVVSASGDVGCIKITPVCSPSSANISQPPTPSGQPVSLRLEGVPEPIHPLPAPWPANWSVYGTYDYCSGQWVINVLFCGLGFALWRGVVPTEADCYPVAGSVTLYRINCLGEGCNRQPQVTIDRP